MSRSPIIIDDVGVGAATDWLANPHAGAILASEFIAPLAVSIDDLGARIGVHPARLEEVIDGRIRMSAELDLRLARYFGMGAGFFLRLQDSHELLEAKRSLDGELDRIVPRAA